MKKLLHFVDNDDLNTFEKANTLIPFETGSTAKVVIQNHRGVKIFTRFRFLSVKAQQKCQ